MLQQENIKLTVKKTNNFYTRNSSGMGKIEGLDYSFTLFKYGSALLCVTLPNNAKQKKGIERLVTLISEAESERFAQFPILQGKIPGIESASKLIHSLKENRVKPAPNLYMEIPEIRAFVIQWGCPNLAVATELMRKVFPMANVTTIEL